MKLSVRIGLGSLFIIFVVLVGVFFIPQGIADKQRINLTYSHSDIGFSRGCSYYTIYNNLNKEMPSATAKKLFVHNIKNVVGRIENGEWEYKINETYMDVCKTGSHLEYRLLKYKNGTCNDYGCKTINKTYCNCSYSVDDYEPCEKWHWVWVKKGDVPSGKIRIPAYGTLEVRFCADIRREKTENGWEVRVDHIPEFNDVVYDKWVWWNSTWTRKKPINISVSSGTTEKNYTVMLNVSYDSDMQSDFGDLRFLNGSENAELPYWVEYNVTSNYAYVWVKIDQNITTTNYTIYMYYGNEDADTTSEGMDTFEMFDDFNNLTYWTQQSGTWNATDGVMNSPDALGSASYLKYNYSVRNDNYSIHLRFRVNDGSALYDKRIFLLLNGNSTLKYDEAYEPCYYQSYSRIYSDYNVPSWSVSEFDLSAWYYGEIKFQTSGTNVTHAELYYDNNKTHIGNHSMDGNLDHQGHYFGFLAIYAFFSVDYVFMRKYQLPEPTYAFGTEIFYDMSPPNITIWHPENTTYNTTSIDLNWTTNETLDWAAYSLNGGSNITPLLFEEDDTEDSYSCSGSFDPAHPCSDAVDEDWSTYAMVVDSNSYVHENFTIINTKSANWTIKYYYAAVWVGGDKYIYPSSYWNGSDWIQLSCRIKDQTTSTVTCQIPLNGLNDILQIKTEIDYSIGKKSKYYEGKVIWFGVGDPLNVTITAQEGQNNITIWGNDSSGNMASDTVWFTVDTTPPTVTIDSPTNGSFYNTGLTINGTTSDLHKDSCWLNDTSFNSSIINVSSTGTFNFSNTSNLVDGTTYYITVICNDTVNNTNYTTVYFTYDVSGPNITTPLIYHDNIQYTSILRGSNITVKVNITDATGIDNNSVILNITDPNGVNKVYDTMGIQYQENPDETSCVGTWDDGACANVYDGDWDTYGNSTGSAYYYPEYTKPSNSYGAIWQVKDGNGIDNLTIPSDCWNYDSTTLFLSAKTKAGVNSKWYCKGSGGVYQEIRAESNSDGLYEEAIWWKTTNGYLFEYNVTVYLNWTNGTYSVNITANDTFNQTGINSTQLNIYKLTITEGSVIQGDAEINKTTKWQRTDSVYNPLATSYTNFIANTSIVSDVVWYELWNDTDNHTDDILTVNLTGNCIEWLISNITATETQSWNLYYNTTIINYTKYNETVGGIWYLYLNVTNNVTNITDVYTYSDVYEINRTYVLEELISGTWTDRTDNASYTFRNIDTDGDGSYDKVSWYVPLLDGLRQFRAYISYIVVVENKTITNPPVTEFKPINWLDEVTLKNVDTVSHSYSIKIYLPYDAVNIRVDDVSTEPKYDANGRYVTLTGTLAGGSQIIHEIEYSTPPTSVTVTIDYPDIFWVDEKAIINMNVSVKNWASQNITDVEKSITIDYGEELYLCEDFVSVCNESNAIDSADIVSGTYVLEIGNMTPFEIHNYTISYLIYTAVSEEQTPYRENLNGSVVRVDVLKVRSVSPIPMQTLKVELPDINCSNVVKIDNALTGEEYNWTCGSVIVDLGLVGQGDVIELRVYTIEGPAPTPECGFWCWVIWEDFLGIFDLQVWHVILLMVIIVFIIVAIRFDFGEAKRRIIRRIKRKETEHPIEYLEEEEEEW